CDEDKPNNGGRAESISNGYNRSFGPFMAPIASGVNGVRSFPVIGDILDAVDSVIGSVASSLISALGLDGAVEDAIASVTVRLLDWLGVGPMYDGSKPGAGNLTAIGSAVVAESSTRASGGFKSTKQSLRYTNKLARYYMREQRDQMSTFERYASLEEPNSVAAQGLATISTGSLGRGLVSLGNSLATGSWITSLFRLPVSAQSSTPSSDMAEWAGVDTYDLPENCMNLDPLTMTINDGTNLDEMVQQLGGSVNLTWDTVRDTDAFYQKVYDWVGTDELRLGVVEQVYNCHLLDARVRGSLGHLHGYDDDHGYAATETTQSSSGPTIAGLESPPGLGGEIGQGYYRLPEPPNGEFIFSGATPEIERCGNKALIDVIYTVGKAWKQKYPESVVVVGDLNATAGHQSHKNGVDVDISTIDRSAADVNGNKEKS